MSPIEPRVGPQFLRALEALQSIAPLDELQEGIYIAANNRYVTVEQHGPLRFGTLNRHSNPEWTDKADVHFCFVERGGTFFFTHAQALPYEENDKQARAFRARGLR